MKNTYDEIGLWSEIKHEILSKYARSYSTIMTKQGFFEHAYIDALSGGGIQKRKHKEEFVQGSPLHVLNITPPFQKFYFVELDKKKCQMLSELIGERQHTYVFCADCNEALPNIIFPKVKYEEYKRGLCLLDPYKLGELKWETIVAAAIAPCISKVLFKA
ncbi:MAG TPA: three-Cys-motif partner protein TcmP [bacterium]